MKTTFAAAAVLFLAAIPAMAAEEYPAGTPLVLQDRVAANDTGSAQAPRFDGQAAVATPREQIIARNASEASVETANSRPAVLAVR